MWPFLHLAKACCWKKSCSMGVIRSLLVSLFQNVLFFWSHVSQSTHSALNFIDVYSFQLINQSNSPGALWEGLYRASVCGVVVSGWARLKVGNLMATYLLQWKTILNHFSKSLNSMHHIRLYENQWHLMSLTDPMIHKVSTSTSVNQWIMANTVYSSKEMLNS